MLHKGAGTRLLKAETFLFPLLFHLRQKGVRVERGYHAKSLGSQLKDADRLGANFALIVGENEMREKKGILRNLCTRQQELLPFDSLEKDLTSRIFADIPPPALEAERM